MHPSTIELMHEQVRLIYHAATGAELNETDTEIGATAGAEPASSLPDGDIEERFAELEALVRRIPELGLRVPPFSFTPQVDVIDAGAEVIVEIAVPGVGLDDLHVKVKGHELIISGVRRGERVSNGRSYVLAEIARGPFSRVIHLPCAIEPRPQLDSHGGVIAIRLSKHQASTKPILSPAVQPATEASMTRSEA